MRGSSGGKCSLESSGNTLSAVAMNDLQEDSSAGEAKMCVGLMIKHLEHHVLPQLSHVKDQVKKRDKWTHMVA